MTIANYLTFMRLLISPIFLLIYLYYEEIGISATTLPYLLLSIWIVSELSDAFDGYLARLYNQVTDFGKILDPMADSIAHTTVFLAFTQPPIHLPILFIFVFLYRDFVVSTLRTICALRGFALAARTSGKIKTGVQGIVSLVLLVLMIPHSLGVISSELLHSLSIYIVGIAVIYTFFSGVDYIYANKSYIAKLLIIPDAKQEVTTKFQQLLKAVKKKRKKYRNTIKEERNG